MYNYFGKLGTSSTSSLVLDPLVDLLGAGIGKGSKSEFAKGRSGN